MYETKRKNEDRNSSTFVGIMSTLFRGSFNLARWAIPGMLYAAGWTLWGIWYFIRQVWRGFWRGITWPFRMVWRGIRWVFLSIWAVLRYIFVGRVPASFASPEQEEAFWRIKRQYRRRNFFMIHIFLYLSILAIVSLNTVDLYRRGYQVSLSESVGFAVVWTLFLLFHFLRMRIGDAEDQALRTVMEASTPARQSHKRKRRHDLDALLDDMSDDDLAQLRQRLTYQPEDDYYESYMGDDGEMWVESQ